MKIKKTIDQIAELNQVFEKKYINIDVIVNDLISIGWKGNDLLRNELYNSSFDEAISNPDFIKFWNTLKVITDVFKKHNDIPLFIKCIRTYPYFDKNVDVIVPLGKWGEIVDRITDSEWYTPSFFDRVDQFLIERGKLKFHSNNDHLMMAHLYKYVSWRYQSDMGLLRSSDNIPNENQLDKYIVSDFCKTCDDNENNWFYHPNKSSEIVIQAAHIVFENFRVTLGEVINFLLLKSDLEAWEEACLLSKDYGCENALTLMNKTCNEVIHNIEDINPSDFPYKLAYNDLSVCFKERQKYWNNKNSKWTGIKEHRTSKLFFLLLQPIRSFRKYRKGVESYRR